MQTDDRRRRPTSTIPFGWRICPDDPKLIEPIADQVTLLMAALAYIDRGASIRETARWLSHKAGRYISDRGLAKIWSKHRTKPTNAKRKSGSGLSW